jgi:hypothetical protein
VRSALCAMDQLGFPLVGFDLREWVMNLELKLIRNTLGLAVLHDLEAAPLTVNNLELGRRCVLVLSEEDTVAVGTSWGSDPFLGGWLVMMNFGSCASYRH